MYKIPEEYCACVCACLRVRTSTGCAQGKVILDAKFMLIGQEGCFGIERQAGNVSAWASPCSCVCKHINSSLLCGFITCAYL